MAAYDLTPRIAPNLDRHLVFPLLEFLQERQLYPDEQILKAKIELLNKTNMVDYAMDIHKNLYHTDDVPQDMIDRRVEVVARLKALEDAAAPLVTSFRTLTLSRIACDKQIISRCSMTVTRLVQISRGIISVCNSSLNVVTRVLLIIYSRALCLTAKEFERFGGGQDIAKLGSLLKLNRLKEIIDSKVSIIIMIDYTAFV
ncbi:Cyclin family isoform 1 [Hibiscus syriacus]|uniref:Cyclin family isoform 1 n=1 Tax=Hibiscus syriacus TaxID=106335 RepID=A0A6A2X8H6_HIBSY|nr:Cyclin family isoform 1 [Hibiscus syriacus]